MIRFMLAPKRHQAVAAGVVLAALAVPIQAFACWETCVEAYGTYRKISGSWFRLDHCTETWPDGSSTPVTRCIYSRV